MLENLDLVPWWQAVVLGAVQGLGEFLPISSSAHLILAPWFLGWRDPGLTFDVSLHLGTLLAVLLVFGKDWLLMGLAGIGARRDPERARLFWQLLAATIPGAVIGLLLESRAESEFRHPLLIAGTLSLVGLLLLWADRTGRKTRNMESLGFLEALLIGLAQGLAVVPGVSRAGITMSLALAFGLTRKDAARFSFLLSTPIIAGAALLKMRHMLQQPPHMTLILGTLVAGFVGLVSIQLLLGYLRRASFTPFVVYRWVLAAGVVVWFLAGHPALNAGEGAARPASGAVAPAPGGAAHAP
ncbi:MAG: undecaprenyl-diphosphate phosphatase [Candidatus Eisenbacteria bacterium]|nr:undecaprenyl-diphosphate phosphatase [Candidatus Eisenbacteria bacterium]